MSSVTKEKLIEVTNRAFEEAAFVFMDTVEEIPEWSDEIYLVSLSFESPTEKGKIVLAATKEMTVEMAANMLGEEMDSPGMEKQGMSALAEMLNMTGGLLMESAFGDVISKLGVPDSTTITEDNYNKLISKASFVAYMEEEEGRRIDTALFLE